MAIFTEAPNAHGEGGKIQITLWNGNVLDLSVGDCVKFLRDDDLITRRIESFLWSDKPNPVRVGEPEPIAIIFKDSQTPLVISDSVKAFRKIDCADALSRELRPNARQRRSNARKTRKPTKKVRRNRRANSRRN